MADGGAWDTGQPHGIAPLEPVAASVQEDARQAALRISQDTAHAAIHGDVYRLAMGYTLLADLLAAIYTKPGPPADVQRRIREAGAAPEWASRG